MRIVDGQITTATKQATDLLAAGNLLGALRIFSTFKLGFSKEERRTIQLAFEGLTGKKEFYQKLKIDTDACLIEAVAILTKKYLV